MEAFKPACAFCLSLDPENKIMEIEQPNNSIVNLCFCMEKCQYVKRGDCCEKFKRGK